VFGSDFNFNRSNSESKNYSIESGILGEGLNSLTLNSLRIKVFGANLRKSNYGHLNSCGLFGIPISRTFTELVELKGSREEQKWSLSCGETELLLDGVATFHTDLLRLVLFLFLSAAIADLGLSEFEGCIRKLVTGNGVIGLAVWGTFIGLGLAEFPAIEQCNYLAVRVPLISSSLIRIVIAPSLNCGVCLLTSHIIICCILL